MNADERVVKITVEADGTPGTAGAAGKGYLPGHSASASGRRGNVGLDGTSGRPGGRAGQVAAVLETQPSGQVVVSGFADGIPAEHRWEPKEGRLLLSARGGDGGHGGAGGRGQDGSGGYRGSDATRYSSGGDGGPGGDGGRGGAAGRGGDAGPGGEVVLSLSLDDADLLLGVDWDVSGGTPGPAGRPGSGGSGGPGGSGGSSYSWTETEYYTDSNGDTQSRTVSRYNPGGSSGPSGRSGSSGRPAASGEHAPDGAFTLKIDGEDYADRFRFDCPGYEVEPGGRDGIFEFGERGNRVRSVVVRNVGDSPSPSQNVACHLTGERGVVIGGERYAIGSLAKGEARQLEDFSFHLEEAPESMLPTEHSVLRLPFNLVPRLYFSRLDAHDPQFFRPAYMEVTFPVELETVLSATSVVVGETLEQSWKLHNHSTRPFPPPGRELLVDLSMEDEGAGFLVTRPDGEAFDISEQPVQFQKIATVPPGGYVTVTAHFRAPENSKPYSKATVTADLRLTPQGGGDPRLIQRNPTHYNLSLAYSRRTPDALVIVNHSTTSEEMGNWLDLLKRLNLTWDVWDLSLYGRLPLDELAQKSRGKLVIVLATSFEMPNRETISPLALLDFKAFRRAVSHFGVSFYFIGEQCSILEHLVPQPADARAFSSIDEYLVELSEEDRVNPEVPASMTHRLDKIGVSRFFIKGKPRPEYLRKKGLQLLESLRKRFPQRRFVVTTIFDPSDDSGWLKSKSCGALTVRYMPDKDARSVVTREVYRETAQTAQFLNSAENLLGLFSAQDFDDKLESLRKLSNESTSDLSPFEKTVQQSLADAFLMDLTEEQLDLRKSGVRLNAKKMSQALNRTVEFCATRLCPAEQLNPQSPLGETVLRILAGLSFLAEKNMAWWNHRIHFLGGGNDVEVTLFVRKLVDRFLDHHVGPDRIWGTGPLRKAVEAMVEERHKALTLRQQEIAEHAGGELSSKQAAGEALVRWELRDFLTTDAEAESVLWNQHDIENLQSDEAKHAVELERCLGVYKGALGLKSAGPRIPAT